MTTRCYRYALVPEPVQRVAIEKAALAGRRYWNALVAAQRYAEAEIRFGRRGTVQAALRELLLGKRLTGVAAAQARKRAVAEGITLEQAARCNRTRQAEVAGAFIRTKEGRRLCRAFVRNWPCR
jgi:hypothetical protein